MNQKLFFKRIIKYITLKNMKLSELKDINLAKVSQENLERFLAGVFVDLPAARPESFLYSRIIFQINRRRILVAKRKIFVLSAMVLISIATLIYFWSLSITAIAKSETISLLSLLFSDLKIMLTEWQSYLLYFLEAIPIVPIIYALSSTLVVMVLLKYLALAWSEKNNINHFKMQNI